MDILKKYNIPKEIHYSIKKLNDLLNHITKTNLYCGLASGNKNIDHLCIEKDGKSLCLGYISDHDEEETFDGLLACRVHNHMTQLSDKIVFQNWGKQAQVYQKFQQYRSLQNNPSISFAAAVDQFLSSLKVEEFCEDKSCVETIERISFHNEDLPENLRTITLGSLMVYPKE
ncbi:MAG: hypothetical protein BGO07_02555 [Alphaproteobacteria bacterium 40-19]|nr:MAG: hypothetical protein BGO07_02555 [Alphaproteobacteria bacterium 40-19]